MPTAPFRQLPFEDVPERPILPHRWAETTRTDLLIRTPDLGQTRIAVRSYGPESAPPLVLVHGLMTAGYSFRYVLDLLGGRHRLLIPDLPGSGGSDHPDVYLGPDVLARAVIATIDGLGARGATVIGNSMGGYLCMRAALIDPQAIGRLVNLHSPGVPTARMIALRWGLRVLPARWLLDRLVRRDPERWVHKNVHYFDESLKSREEHREYAAPLATPAGRRSFYRHLRDALDAREMHRFARTLRTTEFPTRCCSSTRSVTRWCLRRSAIACARCSRRPSSSSWTRPLTSPTSMRLPGLSPRSTRSSPPDRWPVLPAEPCPVASGPRTAAPFRTRRGA